MSLSPMYTRLKELLKEKEEIQEGIQKICDSRTENKHTRAIIRRGLPNSEEYHSLTGKLAAVTDEITSLERKIQNKNKIVRFSNLRPQCIPYNHNNSNTSESVSMPLNRTPPITVSSTPLLPSDLPGVNTVLIASTTNTAPIYSSPITAHRQNPSSSVPLINIDQLSSASGSTENIFSNPIFQTSRNQGSSYTPPHNNNNMPNNNTQNNNSATNNSMPNNNNHAQNNNNTRPHNNNTFNNNMPNGNTSSMGKNGGPSDSIPKANDFMGSSSSPKGFTSQQHSFSASRNATPENGNEALLELTQSLVDQVRRLQHELTNMNARISDNENTMHRFYSTMGGLNNSINTAANFSGIKTNQESQMGNRRGQSDFESKYIWKKIERIPYFDGKNLNGLNSFISSCDSVSKTLNDFGNSEHRCAFLSEIDQKITDHAFHSSYETYDVDWELRGATY